MRLKTEKESPRDEVFVNCPKILTADREEVVKLLLLYTINHG
jgi:hypothetical protein